MATQARTWVFATDLEGLVEVGDSATLGVALDTVGNPAKSLEFVTSGNTNNDSERARGPVTAGKDWTVLFPGIPSGATITDVQCTACDTNNQATSGITQKHIKVRIVDSGGTTVHAAGDLLDVDIIADTNGVWIGKGPGTSRVVDAGKQAAATIVALEVQETFVGTPAGINDTDIDNIAITATYTVGSLRFPDTFSTIPFTPRGRNL